MTKKTDPFGLMQKMGPYLVVKTTSDDFGIIDGDLHVVQRDIPVFSQAIEYAQDLIAKSKDQLFPKPEPVEPDPAPEPEPEVEEEVDDVSPEGTVDTPE